MRLTFHSLPEMYRNLRIRHKIFLLVLLIMSGSFIVTYTGLLYAYNIYDEQLYEKSSQLLGVSANLIESELLKIKGLAFNVAMDPDIQKGLMEVKGRATEYDQLGIRATITERLVQYAGNQPNLYSIEIADVNNGFYVSGLSVPRSPLKTTALFQAAADGGGSSKWVYPDSSDPALTLVQQIRSYDNLSLDPIGTLIIRVKMDQIAGVSIAGTSIRSGEMVIASNGTIIYPRTPADTTVPIPDAMPPGQRHYEMANIASSRYFITYAQSPSFGWLYENITPFDHIFNRIVWMKRVLLIVFPASLLLVIVIALSFAGSITGPIERLMGKMKRVQTGQLDALLLEEEAPQAVAMDEVGQLQRTFRMMVQQIDELITENYRKQLAMKEAQFLALQAQINPHFLYNTLDSINWLAKVNGQEEIARMVEALGQLFRYSISLTDTLVTVEQELAIALHYVTIQRCRFDDRLLFTVDVPDKYKQQPIPKLTLQPLLENAIHYGLEPMIGPCQIAIRAFEELDRLVLSVEDGGPGMTVERLAEVQSGSYESAGRGIGLRNIDERIKLSFGEDFGISIDSAPGEGTRVMVTLPL